jgi:hypothetical protein
MPDGTPSQKPSDLCATEHPSVTTAPAVGQEEEWPYEEDEAACEDTAREAYALSQWPL